MSTQHVPAVDRSFSRAPLRSKAAELLVREIPFVFSRKLLSSKFIEEHRRIARQVCLQADGNRESIDNSDSRLVGGPWRLPPLLSPDDERSLFITLNALRYQSNSLRSRINPRRPARGAINELEALLAEAEVVRTHLVEANVRLVIALAGRFSDDLLPFDELFSEGLLILLKAIDGFDFSKGFRFSTYATNSLQRHFFRLKRRVIRKRRLGAPVDDELLSQAVADHDVSLTPDDPVALTRRLLSVAGNSLDPRERQILALRFGLQGAEHTLREIAAVLRVSKERVRQVLARAVGKLQDAAVRLRLEWTPRELVPPPRLGA